MSTRTSIHATQQAAYHVQACVIGAGVIGLATARALAMAGKEVLLLEREATFGTGTSSRNSEVVHAGIYYPTGSLKAKLCVKGKEMLYDYCQHRNIEYSKSGKLLVATNEKQLLNDLPQIAKHASGNGVNDLIFLSGDDVKVNFEPQVTCHGALYSPSSGIVDSHNYMLSLLADAEEYGTTVAFHSPVKNIHVDRSATRQGIIIESEGMHIACDIVVNCAGLHADKIERMVCNNGDDDIDKNDIDDSTRHSRDDIVSRQYYAKGNYYRLEGQKNPFRHLVYPVPEKGGLGIHATIDLGNNCRFGPDVEWIKLEMDDPDEIDLLVDPTRSESFYEEVRKYWPFLEEGSLKPDYCGIRPKLGHPDLQGSGGPSIKADFRIQKMDGVTGFINLTGIESPGLTASMAIADEVVYQLSKDGVL